MKNLSLTLMFASLILSFISSTNAFADEPLLCVKLLDYNLNLVSIRCVVNTDSSEEEDQTAVYVCTDPDAACSVDEGEVIVAGTETGEVEVYESYEEPDEASSTGSNTGGGAPAPPGNGGGDDDWFDKVVEFVRGICEVCHTGQQDLVLLAQSDKNTFVNHEKTYFPKLGFVLAEGDKKYVGKGSYLIREKGLYLQDRHGKKLASFPEGAIILTDRVDKPSYVYIGIEKGPVKKSK